jgi:hypothetical protein
MSEHQGYQQTPVRYPPWSMMARYVNGFYPVGRAKEAVWMQ